MSLDTWLIEPHDSLIVRDGRPFNASAGARARSLDFPSPSTLIGSVRTRIGLARGGSWTEFSPELRAEILGIEMFGSLLAEIKEAGAVEFLAPVPSDSLTLRLEATDEDDLSTNIVVPLLPLKGNYISNIPHNLRLIGTVEDVKGKPDSQTRFWFWSKFQEWLIEPKKQKVNIDESGIGGLISDVRTHVKILDEKEKDQGRDGYHRKANAAGGLFQTRGLEFTTKDRRRLALAIQLSNSDGLQEGVFPLGGERRIVRWSKRHRAELQFPSIPAEVVEGIRRTNHCRLILMTPAYFADGYMPGQNPLSAEIKAVALNRPQVISGWDFALKKPKPTRRMTPPGTVYFLKVKGDIETFIDEVWFKNVGDCEQMRRDGFGLAALGNWDGECCEI